MLGFFPPNWFNKSTHEYSCKIIYMSHISVGGSREQHSLWHPVSVYRLPGRGSSSCSSYREIGWDRGQQATIVSVSSTMIWPKLLKATRMLNLNNTWSAHTHSHTDCHRVFRKRILDHVRCIKRWEHYHIKPGNLMSASSSCGRALPGERIGRKNLTDIPTFSLFWARGRNLVANDTEGCFITEG